MNRQQRHSCGFTMIEAAVATGVVGILMVVSIGAFSSIARVRKFEGERRQAYLLAHQVIGEVLGCYFASPAGTPAAGSSRSTFVQVADYNGYSASPPQLRSGAAMTDYVGWTENVAVSSVDPANLTSSQANSTVKKITVTLTAPAGRTYSLVALRSQYGLYEAIPSQAVNAVTGVAFGVRIGTLPASKATAHPLNMYPGS